MARLGMERGWYSSRGCAGGRGAAALVAVVASLAIGLTGCGGPAQPKLYPATGTVSWKGEPLADATVSFVPCWCSFFPELRTASSIALLVFTLIICIFSIQFQLRRYLKTQMFLIFKMKVLNSTQS